jgi:glycosyltransferase involved in cell wall biosynthesis
VTPPILIGERVTADPALRCLFLAPLKPPDHPVPSGDRMIARQLMALLERIGVSVTLASRLVTWSRTGEGFGITAAEAAAETERCIAEERATAGRRADFVFTYHNYYKAPDIIGPALSRRLGIPYVLAESSRAPKRASGSHAEGHRLAEAASDAASLILTPTAHDQAMLDMLKPAGQSIVRLPPFLDLTPWGKLPSPHAKTRRSDASGPVRLLTVAMMREGYKTQSYVKLAETLEALQALSWTLDIVGDGANRTAIEARFAPLGARVRFHGLVNDREALGRLYAGADLFVWPAISEPIGMVFLEAQVHGLPCVAFGYRGVPDVIQNGVTGVVIAEGDDVRFTAELSTLMRDAPRRAAMSAAAISFIHDERSMEGAAAVLQEAMSDVLSSG